MKRRQTLGCVGLVRSYRCTILVALSERRGTRDILNEGERYYASYSHRDHVGFKQFNSSQLLRETFSRIDGPNWPCSAALIVVIWPRLPGSGSLPVILTLSHKASPCFFA